MTTSSKLWAAMINAAQRRRSSRDPFLNLSILELADRIVLVATPEMPAIQNTGRFIDLTDRLKLDHKLSLVLNRATADLIRRLWKRDLVSRSLPPCAAQGACKR